MIDTELLNVPSIKPGRAMTYKEYEARRIEKHGKEEIARRRKEYYDNNRDKILKQNKIYYNNNKEKLQKENVERNKIYRANNQEKIKAYRKEKYRIDKEEKWKG